MKMKNILIFLILLKAGDALAQGDVPVKILISLNKDSIGILDPLCFSFSILNERFNDTFAIYPLEGNQNGTSYGEVGIDCSSDRVTWHRYTIPDGALQFTLHRDPPTIVLKPGDIATSGQFAINLQEIFGKNINIMAPNALHIRVSYRWFAPAFKEEIFSDIKNIYIKQYDGEDKQAFDYLSNLPVPNFIYEPVYGKYKKTLGLGVPNKPYPFISNAKFIVEIFPKSRFSIWAQVYLAKANHDLALAINQDFETSIARLRESKYYCLEVLKSDNEMAKIYIKNNVIRYQSMVLLTITYLYKTERDISELEKEFEYSDK